MTTKVRFLFVANPDIKTYTRDFRVDTLVSQVKEALFADWPNGVAKGQNAQELRLIHSGQKLDDNKRLNEYREMTPESSPVIHVALTISTLNDPTGTNAQKKEKETVARPARTNEDCCCVL